MYVDENVSRDVIDQLKEEERLKLEDSSCMSISMYAEEKLLIKNVWTLCCKNISEMKLLKLKFQEKII